MAMEDVSFQFLAENSIDVICQVNAEMSFVYVSPSAYRVLGWKPQEMIGKTPDDFILPEDVALLSHSVASGLNESFTTVRMRKKDGTQAWVEIRRRRVAMLPLATSTKPSS